jgi:hypothetical protein
MICQLAAAMAQTAQADCIAVSSSTCQERCTVQLLLGATSCIWLLLTRNDMG